MKKGPLALGVCVKGSFGIRGGGSLRVLSRGCYYSNRVRVNEVNGGYQNIE